MAGTFQRRRRPKRRASPPVAPTRGQAPRGDPPTPDRSQGWPTDNRTERPGGELPCVPISSSWDMEYRTSMNRRVLFVEDDAPCCARSIDVKPKPTFDVDIVEAAEPGPGRDRPGGDYAVIVTDLSMPGMDGLELAQAARQLAPRTLLIMLSAHADGRLNRPTPRPAVGVLDKPCPRERSALDLGTEASPVTMRRRSPCRRFP